MDEPIDQLLRRAAQAERDGEGVTGCLVVRARGSTPQSAGALMLVDHAGRTWGTIGGGCVEAEIRRQAVRGDRGVLQYKLDHDYGWDDGLICGGTLHVAIGSLPDADTLDDAAEHIATRRGTAIDVHVDAEDGPVRYRLDLPPRERLYIAGAGHAGQALARLAQALDFDVTLFDDRPDLLARAPEGIGTKDGDIASSLRAAPVDRDTFGVVVTRGHRHDEQALEALLRRDAGYLGMIGSRRKVKLIRDDLVARGAAAEELDAVHAPIGLDIGAVSVEEIALSIAAQLVEVRRRTRAPRVEGPLPAATPRA